MKMSITGHAPTPLKDKRNTSIDARLAAGAATGEPV